MAIERKPLHISIIIRLLICALVFVLFHVFSEVLVRVKFQEHFVSWDWCCTIPKSFKRCPLAHVYISHSATWSMTSYMFKAGGISLQILLPGKSSPWRTQTSATEDKATGTGPNIHTNKGKVMHRIRLPIRANMKPRSNTVCVYVGDGENSGEAAFIKKLASIKNASPMELHKKLTRRDSEADPNLRT